MLERYFRLSEHQTTVRTELLAGLATFLTMSYIIFVQPAVLSGAMFGQSTGMDFGAITTATCVGAAIGSALMALLARYPVAQAPGMGQNFFFVFSAIPAAAAAGFANPWQVALGMVFISGLLFLALTIFGIREQLLEALSPSMRHAIAGGIGLFIAFIGLQNAGLILKNPGTAVSLNHRIGSPDILIFLFGLLLAAGLHARKVRGSILWGIGGATLLAIAFKWALPHLPESYVQSEPVKTSLLATRFALATGIVSAPPSLAPTFFQMDVKNALSLAMAPFIIIFLFMVLFDTVGTLVAVTSQAGLMDGNKLPRARQAFMSDALATTAGACLGTSTVTAYIESAAGVEQGGRTGLTSLTVAALFLLALFFSPLIGMIGSYPPITAPALVLVGAMMARHVGQIEWDDFSEAVPAFLTVIGIPFAYSIGDGLTLGFISYPIIKILSGKGRQVHWIIYLIAAMLLAYLIFVRSRMP